MPNQPRPENPHRSVRVEDRLWNAAKRTAKRRGETVADVVRAGLAEYVEANKPVRKSRT